MKSVTFIIPVFNEVKTIEKAILEVINLKDIDKEIIILDNCSNDGSVEVLNKFSNHKDVKLLLKKKNLGYGDSIKKGFNLATKELIYIQYADLEYPIEGFFRMIDVYEKTKADVVFGERYSNLNLTKVISEILSRPHFLATLITTFLINIFYDVKFNDIIGSKLYKNSKFKDFEINADNPGFDFELISRIMKSNLLIKNVFVPYKARENSSEKKIKFYHMFNAIYEILRIKMFY
tara:strand:- start:332 stop:1033 length:702 start_codon:yes stop_codon:yes gene_type:complete